MKLVCLRNNHIFKALVSVTLVAFMIIAVGGTTAAYAADANPETVKVGYFAFPGYHNLDEDGNRSGYGYEYLQQIARYTGWTYEYIGYEGSWGDAQRMLENGEIDILTSAQKTPEREKIFDFSDEPIGYSSTIFTISAGNTKYTIDNFDTFNGVRVGMIEGNSRNAEFDAFASDNGFTYQSVFFDDTEKMVEALHSNTIDAIVTSSLRATDGEWIVSSFGVSPYYVCVKKGNQELISQVNEAIADINKNNPGIQNELENKYYGSDSNETVALTEVERNYLENLQQSGKALKVMINPDRAPMSYYEDGKMSGIFGETVLKILDISGLPYEIISPKSRTEYNSFRESHAVDICMDMRLDFTNAENLGYRLTESYYSAEISRITRKDLTGDIKTVAAISNADISDKIRNLAYNNLEIVYYETTDECVNAVLEGKQDAAYLYAYAAEKYSEEDIRNRLSILLMPDLTTDFCVGIGDVSDTVLFSILNKSVASIDEGWKNIVTLSYTEKASDEFTVFELIYTHPMLVLITAVVLIALVGAVVLLLYRQQMRKKDSARAKEIQRLFSYVCREHEKVMEVNLDTMTAREYLWKDNKLCIEEQSFKTEGNYLGFMHPDDYTKIVSCLSEEKVKEIIENGSEYIFEARGNNGNDEYCWYIYTMYGIVPDRDHPRNIMLFKHNVNEIKEKDEKSRIALTDALKQAKEAGMAKGTFMSRMSHEIRTPLNAVIGYMQIAKDSENEPEKMLHCVENSEIAARHLLSIINDVLDVSSIESGKMKIASEPFDLKDQITAVSTIFFSQAKAKGVQFDVVLDQITSETVIGDSLRLKQILMNLLSNAVKFTPENGSVTLSITQTNLDEQSVNMTFTVKDTGIGMSEEYQKRLFQPFEQESASTAQKYGGTGLGLSITFNLIKMMGGTIDVKSQQGVGTTFMVSLMFKTAPSIKNELVVHDFSHIRVLIVDDDKDTCEYMKALFKRCKIKCDITNSGAEALKQLRRRVGTQYKYDLCIVDWNMPEMNGVETARQIKAKFGDDMPIVIATAYDTTEFSEEARSAGVTKIISKPLFQSTMFDLLVSTFGKYEPLVEPDENMDDIRGLHVLLAEDNPMNAEIAVDILTKAGLTIDTVADGKQAVERFTASPAGTYDAILMDVQMPVMNGYEAAGAIRSSAHPEAKSIIIIAMTANAFAEDVNAALASGMNGHIAKPVEYSKLYKALRKCRKSPPEDANM